jgi:hypothetical protein
LPGYSELRCCEASTQRMADALSYLGRRVLTVPVVLVIFTASRAAMPLSNAQVELGAMFRNPWETQSLVWANLLDALRYLVVWNPLRVQRTLCHVSAL